MRLINITAYTCNNNRHTFPKKPFVVYNMLGVRIKSLVSETQPAGYYRTTWNGLDKRGQRVATGLYIYRMEARTENAKTYIAIKKMLLLK